jgi:hypothetical protein
VRTTHGKPDDYEGDNETTGTLPPVPPAPKK